LGIAKIVTKLDYDPFGNELRGLSFESNPANKNNFKFLGRESQAETGLIDLIHRQYDPVIGRFTSIDPVTDGQEHLSLYQYGWNNPILKSDPNGLWVGEGLWNSIKNWWNSTASKSHQEIGSWHNKRATGTATGSGRRFSEAFLRPITS
jgi:RHS repeat-associated protein